MRNFKGGISDLSRLFAEDCTKQSLLGGKLGFALGRNFTYKYIAGTNFRTYADNTVLVKVLERVLADVGNISRDLLCAELCISRLDLMLFYMN